MNSKISIQNIDQLILEEGHKFTSFNIYVNRKSIGPNIHAPYILLTLSTCEVVEQINQNAQSCDLSDIAEWVEAEKPYITICA